MEACLFILTNSSRVEARRVHWIGKLRESISGDPDGRHFRCVPEAIVMEVRRIHQKRNKTRKCALGESKFIRCFPRQRIRSNWTNAVLKTLKRPLAVIVPEISRSRQDSIVENVASPRQLPRFRLRRIPSESIREFNSLLLLAQVCVLWFVWFYSKRLQRSILQRWILKASRERRGVLMTLAWNLLANENLNLNLWNNRLQIVCVNIRDLDTNLSEPERFRESFANSISSLLSQVGF